MTKKEKMYKKIEEHGKKLIEHFPDAIHEPFILCKKLQALENKLSRINEGMCSIPDFMTYDQRDKVFDEAIITVKEWLGCDDIEGLFINCDPRGYAIKIDQQVAKVIYKDLPRDFGGYAILAPDFSTDWN